MKPSSFENAIRLQFDCLARKVIGRTVKNYNKELPNLITWIYPKTSQHKKKGSKN